MCFFRPAFASIASFAAYASRPTFVSTALHSPDTIKLPESNISPAFLTTSSDSPVTNDSLTRTNPSTRIASALSWFPAENTHKSPLTRVSEAIVCNCPSLITDVLGALTTVSLSRTFLALISCIIPINILEIITGRNVILLYDLTRARRTANTANIRLKYVNTLPATIWPMVLDCFPTDTLTMPSFVNCSTSSAVSPFFTSVI